MFILPTLLTFALSAVFGEEITVISGDVLKFTKGGAGKPAMTHMKFTQVPGEVRQSPSEMYEYIPGHLTVEFGKNPDEVTRMEVAEVFSAAKSVENMIYDGKTMGFDVKLERGVKPFAIAFSKVETQKMWFSVLSNVLSSIAKDTEEMGKSYTVEYTFEKRPLGVRFMAMPNMEDGERVGDALVIEKISDEHKDLVAAGIVRQMKLVKCGEIEMIGLSSEEQQQIVMEKSKETMTLTFEGQNWMKLRTPSTRRRVEDDAVSQRLLMGEGADVKLAGTPAVAFPSHWGVWPMGKLN